MGTGQKAFTIFCLWPVTERFEIGLCEAGLCIHIAPFLLSSEICDMKFISGRSDWVSHETVFPMLWAPHEVFKIPSVVGNVSLSPAILTF